MVNELTDGNFKDFITKNKIVIVDYWAIWCGPCQVMAPVFEELSKEMTEVKFAKLNVDESPETAQRYEVNSIPTLILFHKGEVVEQFVGFMVKAVLKAKLQSAIKNL